MQVYELITCVRRANENAGNLISVVQFLINDDNQKLVIFDDYLNNGSKHDLEIGNYYTNSRNKNCCCIYLPQSWFGSDRTIRLNSSHYCIFDFPDENEKNMICRTQGL